MRNSGIRDQYYSSKYRNRFYDKGRSCDRNRSYNRNNQNFRCRNNFRDDRNRSKYNIGDRRNFKHRDRPYDRGRSRDRDNRGKCSRNRRDSRFWNIGRSTSMNKSEERRFHYCREPGHFRRECQKKTRDESKQGGQKVQMQQITEVVERSWLDSWPGTM